MWRRKGGGGREGGSSPQAEREKWWIFGIRSGQEKQNNDLACHGVASSSSDILNAIDRLISVTQHSLEFL